MKNFQCQLSYFQFGIKKLLILLLFVPSLIQAQGDYQTKEIEILISYGTSILPEQLGLHKDDSFSWRIVDSTSKVIANDSLGSLYSYVIARPGKYNLEVNSLQGIHDHVCSNHGFSGSWVVRVSPVKISFDVDSLVFSQPLTSENLKSSIKLSVPVEISFFENSITEMAVQHLKLNVQGVNCTLRIDYSSPNAVLREGQSLISFSISGSAQKGTFIMLDFQDHNGTITTYYPTNEL